MRFPCSVLLALLFVAAPPAAAQIVALEITNPKTIQKLKKSLQLRDGRHMLLGEVLSGLEVKADPPTINRPATTKEIVLLVPDPAKPEAELTKVDARGRRQILKKSYEVSIPIADASSKYSLVFPYQNCEGMRVEYLRKRAQLDALDQALAGKELGSPEWFQAHREFLAFYDALIGWCRTTLYPAAALTLDKDLGKRISALAKQSSELRFQRASDALGDAKIPDALRAAATEYGTDPLFHGKQTKHLRAIAHPGVPGSVLDNGLVLGEQIVEGFRTRIVDPTLGPDGSDPIPEGLFQEFFLCPDDVALSINFFEKYYGKSLGNDANRQRRIETKGHAARGAFGVAFLEFWRFGDDDFDGIVAHRLGHALAELAFARGGGNVPAWIGEGMAYWTSYEFLAHNSVTCIAFTLPNYDRKAEEEGHKPTERGMRATFNALALEQGPPLTRLFRLKLVEMDGAALAKSWSFVDWLIAEHPLQTRPLLSAACAASREAQTDLERWRPELQNLLGLEPGVDAYKHLEDSWRAYAQSGQGDAGR